MISRQGMSPNILRKFRYADYIQYIHFPHKNSEISVETLTNIFIIMPQDLSVEPEMY